MAARASLFLTLLLIAKPLSQDASSRFVIWNVGQGLWTTWLGPDKCVHFDMGGERSPWHEIMALCRRHANAVHISHWDFDHLNFVSRGPYFLPNFCRLNLPPHARSQKKLARLSRIDPCDHNDIPYAHWLPSTAATSNEASVVVKFKDILIPGDSSIAAEKTWVHELPKLFEVRILVLGHHGSRTANSSALLRALPHVQLAIASARKRRYGHPHPEVARRLRQFRIPLLSTEDWGHIHIWL